MDMVAPFIPEVIQWRVELLSLPDSIEALVRDNARAGESFSAVASRLIQEGARITGGPKTPRDVASGEGPRDLGRG